MVSKEGIGMEPVNHDSCRGSFVVLRPFYHQPPSGLRRLRMTNFETIESLVSLLTDEETACAVGLRCRRERVCGASFGQCAGGDRNSATGRVPHHSPAGTRVRTGSQDRG